MLKTRVLLLIYNAKELQEGPIKTYAESTKLRHRYQASLTTETSGYKDILGSQRECKLTEI